MQLTKEEFSSLPIWVKFYNIPLELWTEEGLSYVASVIGKPLFLDEYKQKKSRLNFARICVETQVEKDIPKSFKLNLGYGNPYEIIVEVPWKPKRCEGCKAFGHSTSSCPTKLKSEAKPTKQEWKIKVQTKEEVWLKEQKEESDWQEVRKGKDKSTPIQKERNKESAQVSFNKFDILQSCLDDECSKEEEKIFPRIDEDNQHKLKGIGKPCMQQQKLQTSLSAAKDSNSKSIKAKKKG